ncbi:hypothetical protein BsIDN1_32440 [Bacillus safensis]|uniref:LXG domain-containing protein n=1 Tax=Bacillus safensis TaxID=561879 RepID=A0A5S9MDL9_BACIA|nr:hypothetical protein BsIDN1_32440 [Bacillus safensis]
MKILDAPSLLSAVEQRSKVYQELRDEMQHVKKSIKKSVSGLGNEFTGKGADNIKAFYEDLALFTQTLILTLSICKKSVFRWGKKESLMMNR